MNDKPPIESPSEPSPLAGPYFSTTLREARISDRQPAVDLLPHTRSVSDMLTVFRQNYRDLEELVRKFQTATGADQVRRTEHEDALARSAYPEGTGEG